MSTNNLPNMAYVSGKLTNFVFVSNYIVVKKDSFPGAYLKYYCSVMNCYQNQDNSMTLFEEHGNNGTIRKLFENILWINIKKQRHAVVNWHFQGFKYAFFVTLIRT